MENSVSGTGPLSLREQLNQTWWRAEKRKMAKFEHFSRVEGLGLIKIG